VSLPIAASAGFHRTKYPQSLRTTFKPSNSLAE
jgi:hypothetical protein